ncbi:MAG: ribonuclease III [Proteobacteria bacterium]|nr:ribonuclease III [Pseudomonadota bacterium]MBU1740224.1 ribonuclease III [Pseudomonadota bacterium]
MTKERLWEALQERLAYRFNGREWLQRAMSHPSWTNEAGLTALDSNQRLEFLGDAVLELAVSRLLYAKFPEADEGALTRARAALVNEAALARLARRLDLAPCLRLGRGERGDGGDDKPSILADAVEALFGAVFLDGGLEAAAEVIERLIGPRMSRAINRAPDSEPKTSLQELAQRRFHLTPHYRLVAETGPDHAKQFAAEVVVGDEVWGQGEGRSRKEAERRAAAAALEAQADEMDVDQ